MTPPPREGRGAARDSRLTRSERLRTDREFREVVHKGERTRTAHFAVYRDRRGTDRKIGVSAGRKVGGAVLRNRVKRVLREFYRLEKSAFPPGTRTAIVVREAPGDTRLAAIRAELLPAIAQRWGTKGTSCEPEEPR